MRATTIIEFVLAAIIVIALGALSGWYFFLRGETQATVGRDSARGFGTEAPNFVGALGNAYQNAISSVFGGGAAQDEGTNAPAQELWQVVKTPVAGAGFVEVEGATELRFAERATGYVFSANLDTQAVARLSNTLLPKTYDAVFGTNGAILIRGLDDLDNITTFTGALSTTTGSDALRSLAGVSLGKNILDIALSPSGDEIFYLVQDSGKFVGIRAGARGGGQKRVFLSGVGSWNTEWLPDGRIVLQEGPADGVMGHAYVLGGSAAVKIAPSLQGLMVVPRASSTALIYSTSGEDGVRLFATASTSNTVQLPVRTVAEKCVWAPLQTSIVYCAVPQTLPSGSFIDGWYRGEIHTADAWWEVNVSSNTAKILYAPPSSIALDIEKPRIDLAGTSISFINKIDGSLWVLRMR